MSVVSAGSPKKDVSANGVVMPPMLMVVRTGQLLNMDEGMETELPRIDTERSWGQSDRDDPVKVRLPPVMLIVCKLPMRFRMLLNVAFVPVA